MQTQLFQIATIIPELRPYQKQAVENAASIDNGILVLPTGSGKSHIIASLVEKIHGRAIVLQPTREILESNLEKLLATGFQDVGIYSASLNSKSLGKVTFATIGSIIKIKNSLTDIDLLIIDEAHQTNAEEGMYLDFIQTLQPKRLIGLTATPYRLYTNGWGSYIRMLNRTRPKIWRDISHVTQSRDLIQSGFLIEPEFIVSGIDSEKLLQPNSTKAEYSDQSIRQYSWETKLPIRIADAVEAAIERGLMHILVFANTIQENQLIVDELTKRNISSEHVNSQTSASDRAFKLKSFRTGKITAMVNVGILTTGYDFPRLDCIVGGRPTMSLGLYYQMIGRCVRPHPDKHQTVVYDLVNNFGRFGNPFDMMIVKGSTGLFSVLSFQGRLTGRCLDDHAEIFDRMDFGCHKGKQLRNVPEDYMIDYMSKAKKTERWHSFDNEIIRRRIWQ